MFRVVVWVVSECKVYAKVEKQFFFRLSKACSALSPTGEEHIYPSYRCPAFPYGPAAVRVRGSRGSRGDLRGAILIYPSIYLFIFISI